MTDPLWRGKTKPVAAFLDGPPTSRIAASLLVPPGTEVEVWPAGDRTCPYVETGDEGTSYCRLAEAGDRPTREHGIPRYAMLDVWMALGGEPQAFERMMAEDRRTLADTWAQLLEVVRHREDTDLAQDTNPPFGPEFAVLLHGQRDETEEDAT